MRDSRKDGRTRSLHVNIQQAQSKIKTWPLDHAFMKIRRPQLVDMAPWVHISLLVFDHWWPCIPRRIRGNNHPLCICFVFLSHSVIFPSFLPCGISILISSSIYYLASLFHSISNLAGQASSIFHSSAFIVSYLASSLLSLFILME